MGGARRDGGRNEYLSGRCLPYRCTECRTLIVREAVLTMMELCRFVPACHRRRETVSLQRSTVERRRRRRGASILREIDKRLGLATRQPAHPDDRDGRRVRYSDSDMTRAWMFAIAVAMRTAMNLMCCAAILP